MTAASSTAPDDVRTRRLPRLDPQQFPTIAAVLIFLIMGTYGELAGNKILQYNTVSNLILNNAHFLLLAIGMTLVILTGGIDLSVGAVVALTSVSGVMLINAGWNAWLVMVIMVAMGGLVGLCSGLLIQYYGVQPFIATLAMMFLARGLASILSTVPVRLPDDSQLRLLATNWKLIDGPKVNDLVITPNVLIVVATLLAAFFLLHRSRIGRTVYAIGGSEPSAQLMGLPVTRATYLIYVFSGLCSGLAAVVYTSTLGNAQNITGVGWELIAIASVVIGGTMLSGGYGYVLGSVVGVLVLGLLNVLVARAGTIPPEATTIITGVVLLIFVILQRAVAAIRTG